MPKNKGKGGKNRKKGKNESEDKKRELIFKLSYQEYGQVIKHLGGNKLQVHCFDNTVRICNIRGKMRRKVWIAVGDIVLIDIRDFEDNVGDIIHKYYSDEAYNLQSYGEIPSNIVLEKTDKKDEDIIFEECDSDEEIQ